MLTILKEEIPLSSLQGTKELFSGRKINLSVLSADDRRVRTVHLLDLGLDTTAHL